MWTWNSTPWVINLIGGAAPTTSRLAGSNRTVLHAGDVNTSKSILSGFRNVPDKLSYVRSTLTTHNSVACRTINT